MNRLDSVKIQVSGECIREWNPNFWNEEISRENRDGEESDRIKHRRMIQPARVCGLNDIRWYPDDRVVISLSGKIQREDYFDLINRDNFEHMMTRLNENQAVKFDPNKIYDQGLVLSVDVTQNLLVSGNKQEYFKSLNELRTNRKYVVKDYQRKGNYESIVFEKNTKTRSSQSFERQTFYDKHKELFDASRKKELTDNKALVHHHLGREGLEKFENVARVETRFTNFSKIREAFGVNENRLSLILESDALVNLNQFEKISRDAHLGLFDEYRESDMTLNQIEKMEGMKNICARCNYDIQTIGMFIKSHLNINSKNTKITEYLKKYRELIEYLRKNEGVTYQNRCIEEIRELLKTA